MNLQRLPTSSPSPCHRCCSTLPNPSTRILPARAPTKCSASHNRPQQPEVQAASDDACVPTCSARVQAGQLSSSQTGHPLSRRSTGILVLCAAVEMAYHGANPGAASAAVGCACVLNLCWCIVFVHTGSVSLHDWSGTPALPTICSY